MIKVKLLSFTKEAKKILYASARQCYSKESAYKIYKKEKAPSKKLEKFIARLIEKRHLSPLEHINFTFSIEGISRVCTHQLVRHRIASYSQQSQRYVDLENFKIVMPPVIRKNKEAEKIFSQTVKYLKTQYKLLKEVLIKDKELSKEEINRYKISASSGNRDKNSSYYECTPASTLFLRKIVSACSMGDKKFS